MGVVEVGPCAATGGFELVVEEVSCRDRPLARQWSSIGEGISRLSKAMPVLSLGVTKEP
jgi:hypothetical protein